MGNVNNTVNYLGNIYPIFKLTDFDPYKTFYFIYCEKVDNDNDIKPITFNINGIKRTLDNWYNVEYIEVIKVDKEIDVLDITNETEPIWSTVKRVIGHF